MFDHVSDASSLGNECSSVAHSFAQNENGIHLTRLQLQHDKKKVPKERLSKIEIRHIKQL